ncbi:MAG: hypothetical protein LBR31_08465 [Desulfovibrio sp.]|jgi:ActR/RegA family two-component response regulator|nr:hypothetical protein [Desulfovibrio sp.]
MSTVSCSAPADSLPGSSAAVHWVLLIDDDQQYCALLRKYLEQYSFKFTIAQSARQALKRRRQLPVKSLFFP